MKTFTFRTAQEGDAFLLHQLGTESYQHHFAHLWNNPQEMQAFMHKSFDPAAIRERMGTPGNQWLVAEAGKPVGFAELTWHERLAHPSPQGAFLNKIYLLPGLTGQGLGQAFFGEIITQAMAHGETSLWLEVLAENHGARRFYMRQGMHVMKKLVFQSATQTSDILLMAMSLPRPGTAPGKPQVNGS
ncbi:hypothetical protein DT73_01700 [Mangrovibacter sp. MFB070]|uniref:GNAT family N-acetyltransferase n=1 Tax=Mangrovibacter sp. MFB070 TaxID=1224318 RepID=UPI0004D39FB2|nr:GNAT family N-acetyltransferase [Mangrovibacter sp. MFB070]KEA54382.1 hypothetical protein DT73_01700 [Mangrovibacter sp. MFB070]